MAQNAQLRTHSDSDIMQRQLSTVQAQSAPPCSLDCALIKTHTMFDIAYEWDIRTGRMEWYGPVAARLGIDQPPETLLSWLARINPGDLDHVCKKLLRNVQACEVFFEAYRVVHAQGSLLSIIDFGTAVNIGDREPRIWTGLMAFGDDMCAKKFCTLKGVRHESTSGS